MRQDMSPKIQRLSFLLDCYIMASDRKLIVATFARKKVAKIIDKIESEVNKENAAPMEEPK